VKTALVIKGVVRTALVLAGLQTMITHRGEKFSGYNKPKRTPGKNKKFAVLAKQGSKVRLIRFGDPKMKIKKSQPKRRKSFRARHRCDSSPPSKLSARYWSCKKW
jgi:hypothetical protein